MRCLGLTAVPGQANHLFVNGRGEGARAASFCKSYEVFGHRKNKAQLFESFKVLLDSDKVKYMPLIRKL